MALLAGPLWAAAVVLAALGDRPERGAWELGLAALAALVALSPHLDRLLGIAGPTLDVRLRRRLTASAPSTVAAAAALVVGAGWLDPGWTAASRLGAAAAGIFGGLGAVAVGTRGGPVLAGFRREPRVALCWIAEDDPVPALLALTGLALALSLEEGVAVLAGGGAAAALYWVGLRGELRRRLRGRLRSRLPAEEAAWALVPGGISPLAWRLVVRNGDELVETRVAAPSGSVVGEQRYRAAEAEPTLEPALRLLRRGGGVSLVTAIVPAGVRPELVELVDLAHGSVERPGPGRVRCRLGKKPGVVTTSD